MTETRTPKDQALALLALAGALKSVPEELGERFGFKLSPLAAHVYNLPLEVFEELAELGCKVEVGDYVNGGRSLRCYAPGGTDLYLVSVTFGSAPPQDWREAVRRAREKVTP